MDIETLTEQTIDLRKKYAAYIKELKVDWQKLDHFFLALLTTGQANGFIAEADVETLWQRHILDSLLPLPVVQKKCGQGTYADMGSGAGLPGLPLAIAAPKSQFTFIEAHKRRHAFMVDQISHLELTNAQAELGRVEKHKQKYDFVMARAFQKPLVTLELALHVLKKNGKVLYWRSQRFDQNQGRVLARIIDMGYTKTEFTSLEAPMGGRGIYLFELTNPDSGGYPRSIKKIQGDQFANEVA